MSKSSGFKIAFNRYYECQEMTDIVKGLVEAYPGLAQWHDPIVLTKAFVFLALQDGHGVTGERIYAYDLSKRIR